MSNSFFKYLRPEDHLQHQFITWFKYQYPGLRYHHSPNEGKRTPFEQFLYKYLGSDSGFPDLQFPSLLLAIELKVAPNKPSKTQLEWLQYLSDHGWTTEVCYTLESAMSVLSRQVKIMNPPLFNSQPKTWRKNEPDPKKA